MICACGRAVEPWTDVEVSDPEYTRPDDVCRRCHEEEDGR